MVSEIRGRMSSYSAVYDTAVYDGITVLPLNSTFYDGGYGVNGSIDLLGSLENQNGTGNWSNVTEVDIEDLLERYLGSRHRSMAETIILTIVYGIIFITGVLGNVCTCIIIAKNSYMQTATNYYLVSLACSDMLTLILGRCLVFTQNVHHNHHHIVFVTAQ